MNLEDFLDVWHDTGYSVTYEGHLIIPKTAQRRDTGEWTTSVSVISKGLVEASYYANNTSPTKEKAVEVCVDLAKGIIDGRITPRRTDQT